MNTTTEHDITPYEAGGFREIYTDTQAAFVALNFYELYKKQKIKISIIGACDHQDIDPRLFWMAKSIKECRPDIADTLFNGGSIELSKGKQSTDIKEIYQQLCK